MIRYKNIRYIDYTSSGNKEYSVSILIHSTFIAEDRQPVNNLFAAVGVVFVD